MLVRRLFMITNCEITAFLTVWNMIAFNTVRYKAVLKIQLHNKTVKVMVFLVICFKNDPALWLLLMVSFYPVLQCMVKSTLLHLSPAVTLFWQISQHVWYLRWECAVWWDHRQFLGGQPLVYFNIMFQTTNTMILPCDFYIMSSYKEPLS